MNILVVYFSKYGNTQKVAEAIAGNLQSRGDVRLLSAETLIPEDFYSTDLLIMGTPTHKMNLPEALRPILDSLPKKCLQGVRFASFDTSYKMSAVLNWFTAGKKLSRKLRKLGGVCLQPPEIFLVTGREGPLASGELDRAAMWAARLRP